MWYNQNAQGLERNYYDKFYQILHSLYTLLREKKMIHIFLNQDMLGKHGKCTVKYEECNGSMKEYRIEAK